jgi:hypothetical protein
MTRGGGGSARGEIGDGGFFSGKAPLFFMFTVLSLEAEFYLLRIVFL